MSHVALITTSIRTMGHTSDVASKIDRAMQDVREGNTTIRIMSCVGSDGRNGEVACALEYVSGCDLGSWDGMSFDSVVDMLASQVC